MTSNKIKSGILSDSVWLTFVKLVTALISIIITKILSEKLSLIEYGTYSQGNLIVVTVTSLSILGLSDGANYFFNRSRDEETQKTYIDSVFGIQLVAGVICSIAIFGGQRLWTAYFDNDALSPIYIWLMFSPMLSNYIAMYQVLFVSIGKAKVIAARNFILSVMKLLIVIAAVYFFEDIVVIFALLLLTDAIQTLYFAIFWRYKKFWINPFKINAHVAKEIFAYCIPLAIYILTNTLTRDLDKLVVSKFTSTEEFAIFTNCAKVLPFDMFSASIATVMIPTVTRYIGGKKYEEAQQLYRNYLCLAYTTTWIIAAGAVFCASDLMKLLYDEKYLSGLWVFVIYIFVDMIRFANVAVILRAKGKSMTLMLCSFAALLANLILNITFVQWFGVIGPAISTLFVTLGMNIFLLMKGADILQCKLRNLLDIKDMSILFLQLLVCVIPLLFVTYLFREYLPQVKAEFRFFIAYATYGIPILLMNVKKILKLMKNINNCRG